MHQDCKTEACSYFDITKLNLWEIDSDHSLYTQKNSISGIRDWWIRATQKLKEDPTSYCRRLQVARHLWMADFTRTLNSVEKLNASNYGSWSMIMQYYFIGQKLWDIIEIRHRTTNRCWSSKKVEGRSWKVHIWSHCNHQGWFHTMN